MGPSLCTYWRRLSSSAFSKSPTLCGKFFDPSGNIFFKVQPSTRLRKASASAALRRDKTAWQARSRRPAVKATLVNRSRRGRGACALGKNELQFALLPIHSALLYGENILDKSQQPQT